MSGWFSPAFCCKSLCHDCANWACWNSPLPSFSTTHSRFTTTTAMRRMESPWTTTTLSSHLTPMLPALCAFSWMWRSLPTKMACCGLAGPEQHRCTDPRLNVFCPLHRFPPPTHSYRSRKPDHCPAPVTFSAGMGQTFRYVCGGGGLQMQQRMPIPSSVVYVAAHAPPPPPINVCFASTSHDSQPFRNLSKEPSNTLFFRQGASTRYPLAIVVETDPGGANSSRHSRVPLAFGEFL